MFIEAMRRRALLKAVRENDVAEIAELLDNGADINCAYANPMVEALDHNAVEAGAFLLEKGANPNATTPAPKGRLPSLLSRAVEANNTEFVRMLLDHPRIDPAFGGYRGGGGETHRPAKPPLETAEELGHTEAAFMIASHMATKLRGHADAMADKTRGLQDKINRGDGPPRPGKFGV